MNQSIRILIVDDDPNILSGTARIMEKAGYGVDIASSGEAAILSIRDHYPDLIVLDRDMPGIGGIEVCRQIKRDPTLANIMVVMASASFAESDHQAEGLEAGADGYIARPIANREFVARIESYVRILRLTRSLRLQAEQLKKSNETITAAHLATLNVMEDTVTARDQLHTANRELRNEIVERQKAEEERARVMHELEVLLNTTDEGIFGVNLEGNFNFINRAGAEMAGWEEGEIIGQNVHETLHHHKRDGSPYLKEECPLLRSIKSGEGILEDREVFWRKDNTFFSVEYSSHAIREKGALTGAVVTFSDISARKIAETRLLASEVRYRRLFESAKDGILILDADAGVIVDVNPFLMELLDYPRAHFLGKQLWEIGCFKDIEANQEAFRKLKEEKYIRYDDLPLQTRAGRLTWVEFVSNIYDVNGKQVIQCNIRDITERIIAERSLRQLAAIVEFSDDAIISKDLKGVVISWNKGAEKLFGYSASEMVDSSILRVIPVDRHGEECQILAKIGRGEIVDHFETLRQTKDGRLIEVSITASPIKDATGKIIGASKLAHDITERIRAGKKIRDQLSELMRWQAVMINREERSQQLKAEVNTLLAFQNQPSRYPSQDKL